MIMTTFWTTPLLLVLACSILIESNSITNAADADACTVLRDGIDITETLLVTDPAMPDVLTVNCTGVQACKDTVILDCPRVLCAGKGACYGATIDSFALEVLCSGQHACQRTQMVASPDQTSAEFQRNVVCLGVGSCDVATIDYNEAQAMNVYCIGSKACRRAQISVGQGMVTCRQSDQVSQYMACSGNTQITAKCLQCEESGCKPYINECQYQPTLEAPSVKCQDGPMGECQAEFNGSVSGTVSNEEQEEGIGEEEGIMQQGEIEIEAFEPGEP